LRVNKQQNKVSVADTELLHATIIDAIQDVKGKDILLLDLRHLDAPTDYFIICHGESNTQVKSIGDKIREKVKEKLGDHPNHVEGERRALWVLVDYFTTVVHVFYKEARDFYQLENLWSDAKVTHYQNL
jgi:ribosome-associated protein